MKHITRKPALALTLAALLIFGVLFLTLFQKSIRDDAAQVEALYANTRITFEVLPGEKGGTTLALATNKGQRIAQLPQIIRSYSLMQCRYQLVTPADREVSSMVYGTRDLAFLGQQNNVAISYAPGISQADFTHYDPYNYPCLLEEDLQQRLGLAPGDSVRITPVEQTGRVGRDAPVLELYLAGTYSDPTHSLARDGIIVPEEAFLTDVSLPHLLYNSNMLFDCFYRQFSFRIDPAYNRDYSALLEEVKGILPGGDKFTVATDAKALTLAVRPLERKLAIQRLLLPPLGVLLGAAVSVVAALLVLSWRREVFLRLMWGERRPWVLAKLLLSLLALLLASSSVALGAVLLLAGAGHLGLGLKYLALMVGLSLAAGALPLSYFSFKNLVKLYQTGEG